MRMISLSGTRTGAGLVRCVVDQVAEFFSNLQIWQLLTLQPVDPERPTVPLWKDINLLNIHIVNSEAMRIFDIGSSQSNWPYLLHKMGFVDSQSLLTVLSVLWAGKFLLLHEKHQNKKWNNLILSGNLRNINIILENFNLTSLSPAV